MTRREAIALGVLAVAVPICVSAQAAPAWHLELAHSIRPPEGSEATIGKVRRIAVGDDGTVYVAEQSPPRVARYDATGKFVGVVVRQGSGPHEAEDPLIAMQGDTLLVYDPDLKRLSRISPRGALLDERPLDAKADGFLWALDNGAIVVQAGFNVAGWTGSALRVMPRGRIDTLHWSHPREEDRSLSWNGPGWSVKGTPFAPGGSVAFDPASRLVLGGSRRSRWVVVSGRDTVQIVSLPDHEVEIATAMRDSVWTAWRAKLPPSWPQLDQVVRKERFPTTLPPWVSFDINPRGEWWIGRPAPNGTLGSWDIVDNGRLVGHVPVPNRTAGAMAYGRNFVALLHEDENDVPWIGAYRIVRTQH